MKKSIRAWVYLCDHPECEDERKVSVGDPIPLGAGSMERVDSAKKADKVMRKRYGWSIGRAHFCSRHRLRT